MSYLWQLIFGDTEVEPSPGQVRQRFLVMRQIESTDVRNFLFRKSRLRKNKKQDAFLRKTTMAQFVLNKNKFNILSNIKNA